MVDLFWKKYIIKVEFAILSSEKNSGIGSVVYFCRACSSFRTVLKTQVELHLAEVHNEDSLVAHDLFSGDPPEHFKQDNLPDNPSDNTSTPSQTLSLSCISIEDTAVDPPTQELGSRADQSPLGAHSSTLSPPAIDVASSDSPTAPNSPLSPLSRENLGNSRKRITITLSTSPVATSELISSLNTSHVSHSDLDLLTMFSDNELPFQKDGQIGEANISANPIAGSRPKSDELVAHGSPNIISQESTGERNNSNHSLEPASIQSTRPVVVCNFCDRTFCSKQACELHARTHKVEKKFPCSFCHVSFSQMTPLKRHIVTIHGIVPEPTYLDNSDDKDFELTEELDSDSDDSTGLQSSRRYSQPRRHRVVQHTRSENCNAPRPRGRPKRSSELFIPSLDQSDPRHQLHSIPVHYSCDELSTMEQHAEIRYRTILPRPALGEPAGAVKRITVSRPKRCKRPRRVPRKSYSDDNKAILTPMLCDTVARKPATLTSDALGYPPQSVIYLDQQSLLSSFVAIDSQQSLTCQVQQPTLSQPPDTTHMDETASSAKPAHVLTVAAAYASQLPSVSCATSLLDDRTNGHQSDSNPNADSTNVGSVSLISVPQGSIVPGIQIYPSPWLAAPKQPQQPQSVTIDPVPLDAATTSHAVVDSHVDTSVSDYVECAFSLASMATMPPTQQSIQLYPVIGSDGQTTLYYMATLADAQDPSNHALTITTPETYYTQYSHPDVSWPTVSISESISSNHPGVTSKDPCDPMKLSETNEVFQCNPSATLDTINKLHSSQDCSDSAHDISYAEGSVSVSASFLSDIMNSQQHLNYSSSHGISLCDSGETIEVIDLDASKFVTSSTPLPSTVHDQIADGCTNLEPNVSNQARFSPSLSHTDLNNTTAPLCPANLPRSAISSTFDSSSIYATGISDSIPLIQEKISSTLAPDNLPAGPTDDQKLSSSSSRLPSFETQPCSQSSLCLNGASSSSWSP